MISDRDLQPDLAQRCDICLEMFPDAAQLTQHLQTKHRLAGLTFNAARDCLDSQAACAHCGSPHASMESLRSHICQGRCPMFNPMAASETRPITQAMIDICLHGQLLQQLRAPMTRLHLTLRCLHCSQAYKRACDLANHLMSNHSRLWRQAQAGTDSFDGRACFCQTWLHVQPANQPDTEQSYMPAAEADCHGLLPHGACHIHASANH